MHALHMLEEGYFYRNKISIGHSLQQNDFFTKTQKKGYTSILVILFFTLMSVHILLILNFAWLILNI